VYDRKKLCVGSQVNVIVELACPAEEPTWNTYGRQRREPVPRAPVRVVLVLDVSHSMSEPHGPGIDTATSSQVLCVVY